MTEKTWDNLRWVQISEADEKRMLELARAMQGAIDDGDDTQNEVFGRKLAALVTQTFGGGK